MSKDKDYGELERQLLELFMYDTPDFSAAEELIAKGADVNAPGRYDENILVELIREVSFDISSFDEQDYLDEVCTDTDDDCEECSSISAHDSDSEHILCRTIRFFLDHGFDVHKNNDVYGAQCLIGIAYSTYDRCMIDAVKILLDAGAKNVSADSEDETYTPLDCFATKSSFYRVCEYDHHLSNIFEAMYQIMIAADEGRPYGGIDSYEEAIGKKIIGVFADNDENGNAVFPAILGERGQKNCFRGKLYFKLEDGVLVITRTLDFWFDDHLPDSAADVSHFFSDIINSRITRFAFGQSILIKDTTHYCQPITTLETDFENKVVFSNNFGEVKNDGVAAFFDLLS